MSIADEAEVPNRTAITVCVVLATVMNALDTTIANVALPHIQGYVSASADQITWVLTSYIVATAIVTPLSGWMTDRFGRKTVMLVAVAGFTISSMLCGIASSLPEIVLFRLLQGAFGAPIIPLSQSLLLDINPPEKHGQAMSLWGASTLIGPIMGPTLGGYLTDHFSWRWCFYINLPVGVVALAGIWMFVSGRRSGAPKRLDFLGYSMLALFVVAFQLMLDRGASKDWFSSREIWAEAIVAAAALWVFVAQMLTARRPFVEPALVQDRNYVTATIFIFFVSTLMFSTMSLMPPMLQGLMGYPVMTSGLVMAPRGMGSFVAMLFVGRLVGRLDMRLILLMGLGACAYALWSMSRFDLSMGVRPIVISGFAQGLGTGMLSVPLSVLAFATLEPRLRPEASAMYAVVRGLGSSVGISIMQALAINNAQAMHASLAAHVVPSDAIVRATLGANLGMAGGPSGVDAEINRQAMMVAYVDDFKLMFIITLICMPMLLLMRTPRRQGEPINVDHE